MEDLSLNTLSFENFQELSLNELDTINGGDWPGEGLVNAIFESGRKMGYAIGNAIWG